MPAYEVPVGTDIAGWCLGDPATLPTISGVGDLARTDAAFSAAASGGLLVRIRTGVDGPQHVQVWRDEVPPDAFLPVMEPICENVRIIVTSGLIWVAGEEAFLDGGRVTPNLGRSIELTPGVYGVSVYLMHDLDGAACRLFQRTATLEEQLSWLMARERLRVALVTTFLSVLLLGLYYRSGLPLGLVGVGAGFLALPWLWWQSIRSREDYVRGKRAWLTATKQTDVHFRAVVDINVPDYLVIFRGSPAPRA